MAPWGRPILGSPEFVANMEDVLSVYERLYNPAIPVLCMDEQPVQLTKEVKPPIAATMSHPRRVDYEYERAGVTNVFMLAEPLAGWREVSVRSTKTKIDFAQVMAQQLEGRYANCEKVIEAFEPERAFAIASRIEFHYTPKHGSWLNIAENELSSMTRQCVANRRIGDSQTLQNETTAWADDVSIKQRTVDWQMRLDDARCKLKSVYPRIPNTQP